MFLRQKSETFCDFTQLRKDLGEIATPSELPIEEWGLG